MEPSDDTSMVIYYQLFLTDRRHLQPKIKIIFKKFYILCLQNFDCSNNVFVFIGDCIFFVCYLNTAPLTNLTVIIIQ